VGAGIHSWGDLAQQRRFLELGAGFLIHSADISLFQKHLCADLAALRQAVGAAGAAASPSAGVAI
jgi:4-hydroxy-2-oxoheptanedioate aldolase